MPYYPAPNKVKRENTFMKVAVLFLLFCAAATGCKRPQGAASALSAGIWKCDVENAREGHFQSLTRLDSEGRYICEGSITATNGVRTFTIQGTMRIEDGYIVDTYTNHSNTNATLPHTSRAKIIRQSEGEIVAMSEGAEIESTMRRVK